MYKKSFIIIATIIYSHAAYCGNYPGQTGHAVPQHQFTPDVQGLLNDIDLANQSEENRKTVLAHEEKDQYFYTKLFASGAALCTAGTVVFLSLEKYAIACGGCVGTFLSAVGAAVSFTNENNKSERRRKERIEIAQRQTDNSKRKEEIINNFHKRQQQIRINITP